MSRSWFRVSLRFFAILVLIGGLVAGVYAGVTRQAQEDAAKRSASESAEDRALSDLDRISRDASRAARSHKTRADALDRAEDKAAAAGKDAAARAAAADKAAAEEEKEKEDEEAKKRDKSPSFGPIPDSCKEYSGNRAIGCTLLLEWGYKLDQMPCLDNLWTKESGWNERATNPNSGAYGIPQALPGSKMSSHGDDWRTNPATQIKWGLDYIKGRYQTPCGAWSFFQNNGWY